MDFRKILKTNNEYFEDFVSRSTYNSNAIEGNTLSFADTYAIIFNDNTVKVNAQPKEIYEAINHKYALNMIIDRQEKKLDQLFLIDINKTINKNIIFVGGYRLGPVRIIGSNKKFPKVQELQSLIDDYIKEYNEALEQDFSFEKIAKLHIDFENIHPFPDGNGRTGRLLINYYMLIKNQIPIVIPIEQRSEYLSYMEKNDVEGLSKLLEKLQKEEKERINDFVLMNTSKQKLDDIER